MASIDERVAFLEGRVEEEGGMLNAIREAIANLDAKMDRRFDAFEARIDQRFGSIDQHFGSIDQHFGSIDQHFASIDQRFASIDQRFLGVDQRFLGVDQRLDAMDAKMSRQFMWLVGLFTSGVIATLATLAAVIAR